MLSAWALVARRPTRPWHPYGHRWSQLRAAGLGFEGSLTQMPREPAAGDRACKGWWPRSVYEPAWQQ